ncbi:2-succinylbenzoate--CoA ligase [Paraburkholderia phenoliruptrix]|uniref:2-succinylbenzoate--CoA ligase n=1 Tax=Paraburkholderia phenoliruptrix TaxID=252970 RepID=A0A6J4ZUC7_9BURK|nr:AMP-binding protein [Paraburkholderia phenoliruptrix]CAB3638598.1 2-succinylbenzoate--CoA ligase [Paraburkholderia phenoliruptrix]
MNDDAVSRSPANVQRLLQIIDAFAAEVSPGGQKPPSVRLDTYFERDLGLDSLARTELLGRIEKALGVRFPLEVFGQALTPRDLLRALDGNASGRPAPPVGAVELSARGGALDPPSDAGTLVEVLQWHASRRPERTHIVVLEDDASSHAITYAALHAAALRVSRGLRELGVGPGDTVALMLPTGSDYFACFAGILLVGAIVVPVYPPARSAQIDDHLARHAAILSNARARVMIAPSHARAARLLAKARIPTLHDIVTAPELMGETDTETYVPQAEDVALLQYTSGSTGTPKGVVLTHANLLANIRAMGETARIEADDVFASWLPLYHDMGLIGAWFGPLYFGIPLIIMSPLSFLARPARWLQTISRHHATLSAAPNFAYERCTRKIEEAELDGVDLSSLRLAFCGAEPVSASTMRAFASGLANHGFSATALTPVYGLAENTLGLTFSEPGRGLRTDRISRARLANSQHAAQAESPDDVLELVSCGRPLRGNQIRVVDAARNERPERAVGRIEFRSLSATRGYFQNPDLTARLIHDGWIDTGDLGYMADEELFITGRVKDLVIRAGRHFFPYELEAAVGLLPGVRAGCVAVCGAPDVETGTDRLIVIAETRATDPAALAAMRTAINEASVTLLGAPPEEVALVPAHSILKTSSGKIRHSATLDLYLRSRGHLLPRAAWRQWLDIGVHTILPVGRRLRTVGKRFAYGAWCWFGIVLIAVPAWLAIAWNPDAKRNWVIASRAARLSLKLAGIRITVRGADLIDASRPAIVVANHASYLDGVVLLAALPSSLHIVAKRELASTPLVGRFLHAIGVRFVERVDYRRMVDDERALVKQAMCGASLLFFPEATFVRSAGLRQFRLGAFVTACVAHRPVIPVAIAGTRAVLPDGQWWPVRADVTVTVLAALAPPGGDMKAAASLRDAARDAIAAYCGEKILSEISPLEIPAHHDAG